MNNQSPWDSLRQGKTELGLSIIREWYKREPDASHIMELGVAYLWIGDYPAAEQHFCRQLRFTLHPDQFAREAAEADPRLAAQGIEITPRGGAWGPDFYNPVTGQWWDITTPGQWLGHVAKYGPGGTSLAY